MAFTQPKIVTPYGGAINKTLSIAQISAQSTLSTDVSWPGVDQNSIVFVRCDSLDANLLISNPCVCTAGVVKLKIGNLTASPVTPTASLVFNFIKL